MDEIRIEPGIANAAESPTDSGIFVDGETGHVRARLRNRALVSAIDDLAYKAGFNYSMLSDLSTYRISIEGPPATRGGEGAQLRFASERELLDRLIAEANRAAGAPGSVKIHYRWVSDGPEFFLSPAEPGAPDAQARLVCTQPAAYPTRLPLRSDKAEPADEDGLPLDESGNCGRMTYKKMFFKNITADQAVQTLTELFPTEIETKRNVTDHEIKGRGYKAAIVSHKPQNAVLVRGTDRRVYERLASVMPSLDADFQLVLVETQVFEYDDSIARKIGVALDYTRGRLGTDPSKPEFALSTQFGEGVTSALPTFFFNLSDVEKKATLLSKLTLFDREGLVRIMAEPRLTLKSGERADVRLTTKRYYITPGVNTPGEIRELQSGITLDVTPTVLGDSKILLNLRITQTEFLPSADPNAVATTTDNSITTSVVARDGELVSLGGILAKRDSKFESGIPGLRKLPLIGYAFGSEASDGSVTRIEFLIRPSVKRVSQKNEATLRSLRNTNCRMNKYLNKSAFECEEPQSSGITNLDGPSNEEARP